MAVRFRSRLPFGERRSVLDGVIAVVAVLLLALVLAVLAGSAAARRSSGGTPRPSFRSPVASTWPRVSMWPSVHTWPPVPTRPPVHTRPPAPTSYLALGDSLAFGYSQAKFDELLPTENPADFETGYVNVFGDVLKAFDPGLQIVNDGCPGETTESFIKGPCAYQLEFPLHHPYVGGPTSSQLSDALAYLAAHRGRVDPITIDIGANDALGLIESCKLEPACVAAGAAAEFAKIASNLGLILGELRAGAPHAQIVVLGLYNPFGETIAGGDALTAKLNEVEAGVAAGVGARFADPLPIFNPPGALEAPTICLLTNMCTPLKDIHPTDLGYKVLGGLVLQQYVLGLSPLA
jgi:lysophospholipase L1-like esterase